MKLQRLIVCLTVALFASGATSRAVTPRWVTYHDGGNDYNGIVVGDTFRDCDNKAHPKRAPITNDGSPCPDGSPLRAALDKCVEAQTTHAASAGRVTIKLEECSWN